LKNYYNNIISSQPIEIEPLNESFQKQEKIKKEIVQQILNENKDNNISLKKMAKRYHELDPSLQISHETIRIYLRRLMRKTFKKPQLVNVTRNTKRVMLITHIFAKKKIELLSKGKKFVYLDECTFSTNHKSYRRWTDIEGTEEFGTNGRRGSVNVIVAMSEASILHYPIVDKTTISDKFVNFLRDLVPKLQRAYEQPGRNYNDAICLYFDKASVHSTK